ncbi:MAG: transaldolase, partial [Deltaproteobacteria bacterium]|nr:transaldolase [Deltaproteobacteria bacterium]
MTSAVFEQIAALGQSIWYDNISREVLASGELARLIAAGEVRGVTSNPTIFEKAITGGSHYDAAVAQLLAAEPDLGTEQLYERLAIEDICAGADLLLPVFEASRGSDGHISIEVSPRLAHDTAATVDEARRLHRAIGRPNVMIKVPVTAAGLPAIAQLIGDGISVNVTLIFSHQDWRDAQGAYLTGLESWRARGGDLTRVSSVASFFVSRIDTAVDALLPEASPLRGSIAVAYSKLAYREFARSLAAPRCSELTAAGGQVQRLLWASTGTKNPAYSDLLYVENLFELHTVNTVPPATLAALRDHGRVAPTAATGLEQAAAALA